MSAVLTLCATGLAMGIVHVLTGADHLSAIATLSVNVGNFRAFWYGVRWGIGHSIGLVVVGSAFITLENLHYNNSNSNSNNQEKDGGGDESSKNDNSRVIVIPEKLENLAECFVGIFMIALGLYNLYGAYRTRREKQEKGTCKGQRRKRHCHHHHCHHLHDEKNDNDRMGRISCDSLTATTVSISNYGDRSNKSAVGRDVDDEEDNRHPQKPQFSSPDDPESLSPSPSPVDPMGIDRELCKTRTNNNNDDNMNDDTAGGGVSTKKFLSLWIGIFHGVAGPGGVLGVVPAVKLHNVWHSVVYLGSFCASSIAVMGLFAALYGSLSANWTRKDDNLAFRMEVFSASLSLLVGCTWLVLLYLGILDDVFP